jgi:hypothetical protein
MTKAVALAARLTKDGQRAAFEIKSAFTSARAS